MAKINIQQKGNNTVYKVGRSIVCYRYSNHYCIGKPSDTTVLSFTVQTEEVAHSRCIEVCENLINTRMRYENPVKHHALAVLTALAH